MTQVRTRIAPSPTGYLHIGNARTALFNFLFARHHKGTFVLRLEDTDKERSKKEYADDIFDEFSWLGLAGDEIYIQTEHVARHRKQLQKLIDTGKAYVANEPSKEDASRTVEVVRLKNPGTVITFNDLVRGDITFDTSELKDFVIARSIDEPLYHFAVVADDGESGITHVIRGEDHISNTPRQILMQEALDLPRPLYAHLPLIMAPDRTKLSKRKHHTSVKSFREEGFLAPAMVNFMALLGWNPGTPQEIFSMDELVETFSLNGAQKGGAIFDIKKLRWFNKEYLKRVGEEEFNSEVAGRLAHADIPESAIAPRLITVLRERMEVWGDIDALLGESGELRFVVEGPKLDASKIPWRGEGMPDAHLHLTQIHKLLANTGNDVFTNAEAIKMLLWSYADEHGRGSVLWPLRYALTGQDKSPDPFTVAHILGREESIRRIEAALGILSE